MSIDRSRAISFLEAAIRFPHPQTDMQKVRGFIAKVVRPILQALPFNDLRIDDYGNLIAHAHSGVSSPPLVLCTYGGIFPASGMQDAYDPKIVDGPRNTV